LSSALLGSKDRYYMFLVLGLLVFHAGFAVAWYGWKVSPKLK